MSTSEQVSSDSLTTRDGIKVSVGQSWRNCDKRMNGQIKEVIAVDAIKGRAKLAGPCGLFATWNSVRRMYRHATGWELVE